MTQKNDDDSSSLFLIIVLIFLSLNQCSVDDRLDKIEAKFAYETSGQ